MCNGSSQGLLQRSNTSFTIHGLLGQYAAMRIKDSCCSLTLSKTGTMRLSREVHIDTEQGSKENCIGLIEVEDARS